MLMKNASVGVLKKPKKQAEALDKLNNSSVKIIVLSPDKEGQNGRINYMKFKSKRKFPYIYYDYIFKKYQLVENTINLNSYDYIIMRYPGSDKTGIKFVSNFNIIFEMHTKEQDQLLAKIKSRSSIASKIVRIIKLYLENRYFKSILEKSEGIIANSVELRKYILNQLKKKIPAVTIPNGINIKGIPQTGFKKFNGKELDMVFIGSRPDVWHGLDRLIYSIAHYKKKNKTLRIKLHLICKVKEKDIKAPSTHLHGIEFYGLKFGSELDNIMKNMHLAICPLALYRKGLSETSSLKTAEYMARGIPFIIAYDDTGLIDEKNIHKYYLRFPNDASFIDFDRIITFLNEINKNRCEISNKMRQYAIENLDWTVQMKQYFKFINSIAKGDISSLKQ